MSTGFGARGVGNARWRTKTTRKGEHAPAQELARELARELAGELARELGRSSARRAWDTAWGTAWGSAWGGISPQAEFAVPARIRESIAMAATLSPCPRSGVLKSPMRSSGCIGKLADGRLVSYVLAPDAFKEDCRRAAVIVATRDEPPDCAATMIGRSLWRERRALALRRDGGAGFFVESTRPPNFDRPWAPRLPRAASSDTAASPPAAIPAPPRDATPHPDDLQADD